MPKHLSDTIFKSEERLKEKYEAPRAERKAKIQLLLQKMKQIKEAQVIR
jgi:hypothetical protein